MKQFVYLFGNGKADGNQQMRDLLGGKGANLHEMTRLGLPVPPGFTLTTEVCTHYYDNEREYPKGFTEAVATAMKTLESNLGAKFGDKKNPLLVSVRSGARVSMPGMMDTILNLGLCDQTVLGLAEQSGDERFAYDAYRRFIQMYSDVVLGISVHSFETLLEGAKRREGVEIDNQLSAKAMKGLVEEYKKVVLAEDGKPFPADPQEQLWGAIGAVLRSWMSPRAISYRRINKIPEQWGTAVNVQAMVFGNMGPTSATGVAFTRDPSTGEKRFFGEYLANAQGEDVVAGIRTPCPINHTSAINIDLPTFEDEFPESYKELVSLYQQLETHYRDMQDIEFTVQKGKLFLLQTRNGKRTALAAIRTAVDMVREKLITPKEALLRVTPDQIEQLLHPRLDPTAKKTVIAKGLPASPGAASGEVVFSSEDAEALKRMGRKVILVRHETSPEDIGGMDAAEGILTALGGMTSHAAVVARGMGRTCVAGCGEISIDYPSQQFTVGGKTITKGMIITLDGSTGEVIEGHVPTIISQVDDYFSEFMSWVDEHRVMEVRANAETPHDVKTARQFGAQGVGLCRTEHMFFDDERISNVRQMILSNSRHERERALEKLFPAQKSDFKGIFREMKGLPVTIRLLDPPLHEFLPHSDGDLKSLADAMGTSVQLLRVKSKQLEEINPMLGHRGCRLGISFPEIYQMQAKAIMEAACELVKDESFTIEPEIMVPFVGSEREFTVVRESIDSVCKEVLKQVGVTLKYRIGTMIEIPRAALVADRIAETAEFFSFGTNDLTQMTLGMSRDDAGSFLQGYVDRGVYQADPFVTIDQDGVGQLVEIACERARKTRPDIKIGICGEQGGDTATIEFCQRLGFNYVSCSPFRVPVARLAAAQAVMKTQSTKTT